MNVRSTSIVRMDHLSSCSRAAKHKQKSNHPCSRSRQERFTTFLVHSFCIPLLYCIHSCSRKAESHRGISWRHSFCSHTKGQVWQMEQWCAMILNLPLVWTLIHVSIRTWCTWKQTWTLRTTFENWKKLKAGVKTWWSKLMVPGSASELPETNRNKPVWLFQEKHPGAQLGRVIDVTPDSKHLCVRQRLKHRLDSLDTCLASELKPERM